MIVGLGCLFLLAISAGDVLFYAPFDGSAMVRIARGNPFPTVEGSLKFAEGKFGKALVCGEGGATCRYEVRGNLLPHRGAVEMWIKPLTPSEVGLRYLRAAQNSPPGRPIISLAPTKTPPEIDGKVSEGEWREACSVTGFITNVTGEAGGRQTVAYIAREGRFFYFAFVSPVKGRLKAEVREHDGPLRGVDG